MLWSEETYVVLLWAFARMHGSVLAPSWMRGPCTAGVSMENFLQKGKPTRVPPPQVVDYFMNKLNKTQ
eukprot:scaffold122766_cov18-Tisochrysis_lutea.AAC.1